MGIKTNYQMSVNVLPAPDICGKKRKKMPINHRQVYGKGIIDLVILHGEDRFASEGNVRAGALNVPGIVVHKKGFVEILFSHSRFFLSTYWRVTPSLFQRGGCMRGTTP
jgi:hypothetical protein